MKQVLQELGTGRTTVADVPAPGAPRGGVQIATRRSLISAGTERMLVEFARAGWVDKVRQQPDKVRQVLDKVRTDGPLATLEAVRAQLDRDLPLGYCNVGVVTDVGEDAAPFRVGDRVASNGPHAQTVAVPRNLCARVPEGVSDDQAAFTVLASIGLQGVRLAEPTLGESVVVIGLGLIGLLTVQILRANGCRVIGIDPDASRSELARRFGATAVELGNNEDPLAAVERFTRGRGADAVLITAATKSDEPVAQAAAMCRKRGRIVLVGVAGLKLNRADFYEKELSFQVSCSYGPGRYDPRYEEQGQDYPVGFVRWTEQRNFEAVLDMLDAGTLDVGPLITHRFDLDDAERAYDMLAAGDEPCLGVLLDYPADDTARAPTVALAPDAPARAEPAAPALAMIGAGNYASRILLPAFKDAGARFVGIASGGGQSAASVGRKFGFEEATTATAQLIADTRVNTVAIATRHDSHARWVRAALAAGKHVFVEKPLALTHRELDAIEAAYTARPAGERPLLMVGFNRRFAPHVVEMKKALDALGAPKTFVMTVNAGALPPDHWTQDPSVGGGRILGEACHFIDLLRFLAGAPIREHQVMSFGAGDDDKTTVTLRFADGSLGTVHYFANGHGGFPKERLEAFCAGRVVQLDNYRRLRGYGAGMPGSGPTLRQDKGQAACAAAFLAAIRDGGSAPIPFDELLEVSRATVDIAAAARA